MRTIDDGNATSLDEAVAQRLRHWPGVQRLPSAQVQLFVLRGFLAPDECAALIARIESHHRPSTIADSNGDALFRTSETCDLDAGDPLTTLVETRLFDLNGMAHDHGEPLQGQRYDTGQEFKAHTDYFDPRGADYAQYCATAGQRTWTFMIYLNDVPAGGATRFREAGKTIQPETGKLVAWNNRRADASGNPATLHHAMKVRAGRKYVLTKWYRERPWTA